MKSVEFSKKPKFCKPNFHSQDLPCAFCQNSGSLLAVRPDIFFLYIKKRKVATTTNIYDEPSNIAGLYLILDVVHTA